MGCILRSLGRSVQLGTHLGSHLPLPTSYLRHLTRKGAMSLLSWPLQSPQGRLVTETYCVRFP